MLMDFDLFSEEIKKSMFDRKKATLNIAESVCNFLSIHHITNFLTGSCAFKCNSEYSDIDICVLACEKEQVFEIIKHLYEVTDIRDCDYNNGKVFSIVIQNKHYYINIIPLTVRQFLSWWFATNVLMFNCENNQSIKDKNFRVMSFSNLTSSCSSIFDLDGDYTKGQDITTKEILNRNIKKIGENRTNIIICTNGENK